VADIDADDSLEGAPGEGRGFWFALTAYGLWGVLPVYFKLVGFAAPLEIIAHRIGWALVVLVLWILVRRELHLVRHLNWNRIGWLAVSGLLLAVNWSVYVWALLNERMLEASLGYYVNPLVNMVLGGLFLGERLRAGQGVAVLLATLGVGNELYAFGALPWAGLTLAVTFGFYGLVRKKIAVDAVVGLGIETAFLTPLAMGYLIVLTASGQGVVAAGAGGDIALLALGGPLTAIPLVAFAAAALRLPLTVLGFFQYLAPSLTLLLAVFIYDEPFRMSQAVTFGCIWVALLIFSVEGARHQRRSRASALA
jgi:chloramphenicol-sensitive protein RarD